MGLEEAAKRDWRIWGEALALFTKCSSCGEVKHCRGKRRDSMLCLECWDTEQG